jgi:anti-sigma factor RsiW
MTGLDRNLKRSLARKEAPAGFADRVLERVDETGVRRRRRQSLTSLLSSVAAVLLVGAIGTGAWLQHQEAVRERTEAEQASVLVKIALHIASEKTNIARDQLTGVAADGRKKGKDGTNDENAND